MDAVQSRVASVTECIKRTGLLNCENAGVFTIYFLGCEGVEFTSFDRLTHEYGDMIQHFADSGLSELKIALIGPSLGAYASSSSNSTVTSSGMSISISTCSECYHDFQDRMIGNGSFVGPDLIVLFNPGLWGYDSWIPSLVAFKSLHRCVVLATSYTIEEGEDDSDTIETHCGPEISWNWEIERNPSASKVQLKRSCALSGRAYFDNYAWQCFSIM